MGILYGWAKKVTWCSKLSLKYELQGYTKQAINTVTRKSIDDLKI